MTRYVVVITSAHQTAGVIRRRPIADLTVHAAARWEWMSRIARGRPQLVRLVVSFSACHRLTALRKVVRARVVVRTTLWLWPAFLCEPSVSV